ncbi:lantibiotic dehydratase [Clostridium sp. E02]|uniref:lantibiotic dehydratase n=1 Tax=Clostridium sp. E02 TaxID=2487134 RepID=UPI000F52186D|nr:lantibiotic dehydratase [Clostridium sp. E02]
MKNNTFETIGTYMIRVPYKQEEQVDLGEESVLKFCKDPVFQEQILIASQNLYETMMTFLTHPDALSAKQSRDFLYSIRKYMIRSVTRTTPFGLFSAVGVGKVLEEVTFNQKLGQVIKSVRLDTEWIFTLIEELENTYQDQIRFVINPACVARGNRAFLLYTTDGKEEEISVRISPLFLLVQKTCDTYLSFKEIINQIRNAHPDAPEEKMVTYLTKLMKKGYLISDLRPPVRNQFNSLDYLIGKLWEYNNTDSLVSSLALVRTKIKQYSMVPIGEGIKIYKQIEQTMKGLLPAKSYLQVDLHLKKEISLFDQEAVHQLEEAVGLFVALCRKESSQKTYLDEYRDRFLERYGYEREIPILELLDPIKGIGAPDSYEQPPNARKQISSTRTNTQGELSAYFLQKFLEAQKNNSGIQLTKEELAPFLSKESLSSLDPYSLELYLFPKKRNHKLCWYVSPLVGSDQAGKTFGRFAGEGNECETVIRGICKDIAKRKKDSILTCSFQYLPSKKRYGNVTREINDTDTEISFYTTPSMPNQQLDLDQVVVGIDLKNNFYLVDLSSQKFLKAYSFHMFNPLLQPNVLRLIMDISNDHTVSFGCFPWLEVYQKFDDVPRISYENFVLSGARWKLTMERLKLKKEASLSAFTQAFQSVRKTCNLPDEIYISYEDNRLKIHLNQSEDLQVLYMEMKKSKTGYLILEEVEEGENLLVDGEGHSHCCEVVVPFVNQTFEYPEVDRVSPYRKIEDSDRLILPYDGWLYINLYTTRNREEEMIAIEIPEFFETKALAEEVAYFFIRYQDPDAHIRLRIRGKRDCLNRLSPDLFFWIDKLLENQLISRFSMLPYEREVERYGGCSLIGRAEDFFIVDSFVVSSFLQSIRMGTTESSLEELCVLSLLFLVIDWYENYTDAMEFMTDRYESKEWNHDFKKEKDKYLKICDMEQDFASLKTEKNSSMLNLLNQYRKPIRELISCYHKSEDTTNTLPGILSSLLHMHCNRMLSTDQMQEEKIMAYCEKIMYAKSYRMKQKGLVDSHG